MSVAVLLVFISIFGTHVQMSEAASRVRHVTRLNYGVFFRSVGQTTFVNDVWSQVFHVRLPTMNDGDLSQRVPQCNEGRLRELNAMQCRSIRKLISTAHSLYVNTTVETRETVKHIYDLLPDQNFTRPSLSKRALLPFVGDIMSGLFGTASERQVAPIQNEIKRLADGFQLVVRGMEFQHRRLSGYMTLANNRMDTITNMTVVQEQAIQSLVTEFQRMQSSQSTLQFTFQAAITKITEYIAVTKQMLEFKNAIHLLVNGFLSPEIIDKDTLKETITSVNAELDKQYPGLRLVYGTASDYYNIHDYLIARHGRELLIQIHMPVTSVFDPLSVYKIETFSVPVPTQSGHVTQVVGLPNYLVTHQKHSYYVVLDRIDSTINSKTWYTKDHYYAFRSFKRDVSCVSALFQNDVALVREICRFNLRKAELTPHVWFLSDSEAIFVNITHASLQCEGQFTNLSGCMFCTRQIPCGCSLCIFTHDTLLAKRWWAPKISKCQGPLNVTDSKIIINLATLQAFFHDDQLQNLSGDTFLTYEMKVTLPKFDFYSHRFQELQAADDQEHYDLQKFANRVRNSSRIYHRLSDVITERMAELMYEADYNDLTTGFSWSWYLKWASIFASFLALLLALFLAYKVKVIASTMTLLSAGATAAETGFPKELSYFQQDSDRQGFLPLKQFNDTKLDYKLQPWHFDVTTMSIVILLTLLAFVFFWFYKNRQRQQLFIVLEIGNLSQTSRVRVMTLPGAIYNYSFKATNYIETLAVTYCFPKLKLRWESFEVRQVLLDAPLKFPSEVLISFWTARKLAAILKTKFYCLTLLEYERQFKLLDFEGAELSNAETPAILVSSDVENVTNMQQEERIQVPSNVLQLYPSLTNLATVP